MLCFILQIALLSGSISPSPTLEWDIRCQRQIQPYALLYVASCVDYTGSYYCEPSRRQPIWYSVAKTLPHDATKR